MQSKQKTFITVTFVSLISIFVGFYALSASSTHKNGINRPTLRSNSGIHDPNKDDTTDVIFNRKEQTRIKNTNRKLQRYKNRTRERNSDEQLANNDKVEKNFNKSVDSSTHGKKYLIYSCLFDKPCSGWADRQRAIISGFLLAQITNRTFGIILTSPCDLKKFFVPNEYNWVVDENELVGLSTATPSGSSLGNIGVLDFDKAYTEDLVYFQTKRDMLLAIKKNPLHAKSIPQWAKYSKPVAFKNGWNILMKRTPQFDKKFQKLMSGVPRHSQFVCAHVRLAKNPTIPMETRVINTYPSVKYLWAFLDTRYPNASRIFVATDSFDVREWARQHFKDKEMDTGLTILHIEKQKRKKNSCDGFESVLLDQQVMIHCDVLVCSYSNICKHAAYISGIHDQLFMFRYGKIGPAKTWPEIYNQPRI
ncbi:uncharacterized protein LOC121379918 [Gigantopelta aegis]|uniref:uncharacterized protein LOC121379918 n=1 Tax=Gigantopelta aegis TaxID=1735272 RepID=UPI001B887713|nr:uncharacterized protein LOC121379918 [Gigantopelta aegis]XP_041364535.1 uncharacterized protein LOC121379918 [Gigantopelta aegis]